MTDHVEPNQLTRFVGIWQGEETIQPSKWGPGGTATSYVMCQEALQGRLVTQAYEAERDGQPWLSAHALFAFDAVQDRYSLFWFDSLGFTPRDAAMGTFDNQTLSFVRTSPRGRTRHTYRFAGHDLYEMALESSFDEGASWSLVMNGRYTRVGLRNRASGLLTEWIPGAQT